MTLDPQDRHWLEQAVVLGRLGRGTVHPNPEVGCVVTRDGSLVGQGFHEAYGGPHAEVAALRHAGEAARGATAYVSLEPCNHHGQTPPCSTALVDAGVARVVFGAPDPGAQAAGGAKALRAAGIEVVGPVFDEDRARLENPVFFHWLERKTPWIQIKLAMSVDGRIAAAPGARTAISGAEAGRWVHELRAASDAILVGRTTAVVDDPLLTVRGAVPSVRPPIRVVLDSRARLAEDARMFTEQGGKVHVFVGIDAEESRCRALEQAGASVHPTPAGPDGSGVDLHHVAKELEVLDVRSVLCEGGGALASSLLTEGLVERLHLIVSPITLGTMGVPAFTDEVELDPAAWRSFEALQSSEVLRSFEVLQSSEAPRVSEGPGPSTSVLGRDALVSFRRTY